MNEETPQVETPVTPEEHAEATGNVKMLKSRRSINGVSIGKTYSAGHAAAAQLHGWEAHKAATVEPFKLTREAYELAIVAALEGSEPYKDALSQFAPKRLPAPESKPAPAHRKA